LPFLLPDPAAQHAPDLVEAPAGVLVARVRQVLEAVREAQQDAQLLQAQVQTS
jgi:hypothetical protein